MGSTPSLPSFPGPLWPEVVAPDKGPVYGLNRTKPWFHDFTGFFFFAFKLRTELLEIELFSHVNCTYFKLNYRLGL